MQYVYHLCSQDFVGDTLHSLDSLRTHLPAIYEREVAKYEGRLSILDYEVPFLGVTWTQTVNLSALDPRLLIAERKRLGIPLSRLQTRQLLAIPVERLHGQRCVLFVSNRHWINSRPGDPNVPLAPPVEDFHELDVATYSETKKVPKAHTDYLIEQHQAGEPALGFVFVPHVLVVDSVDVSGLPRIDLD